MKHRPNRMSPDYWINLSLAALAGASGCITISFVAGALITGLVLDGLFDTAPLLTIVAVILSVPVSLWLMVRVVMWSVKTIERRQYGTTHQDKPD